MTPWTDDSHPIASYSFLDQSSLSQNYFFTSEYGCEAIVALCNILEYLVRRLDFMMLIQFIVNSHEGIKAAAFLTEMIRMEFRSCNKVF